MRNSRAFGALITLALACTPAVALAGPADARAATGTELTGSFTDRKGVYNDDVDRPAPADDVVKYKGRLTTTGGQDVAGVEVSLERRLPSEDSFQPLFTKTTDRRGRAVFSTRVEGNAKYRVVFAGRGDYTASRSGVMQLKAMRDFNPRLVEKGAGAGKRVLLKGNINPGWGGRKVSWQKRACGSCGWKTVATQKSGDNGGWKFEAGYPPVGRTWSFRAKVKATDDFVTSLGSILRTRTVQARGLSGNRAWLG